MGEFCRAHQDRVAYVVFFLHGKLDAGVLLVQVIKEDGRVMVRMQDGKGVIHLSEPTKRLEWCGG